MIPAKLEYPMVFAGAYGLVSLPMMIALRVEGRPGLKTLCGLATSGLVLWLAAVSPSAVALVLLGSMVLLAVPLLLLRREPEANLWDQTMLAYAKTRAWYASLWLWWIVLAAILVGIYIKFW